MKRDIQDEVGTREITKAINALLGNFLAHTATYYISPTLTVRCNRRRYGNGKSKSFSPKHIEVLVTVGRPNAEARKFIAIAKKAKEPFPIKKVQLKFGSNVTVEKEWL